LNLQFAICNLHFSIWFIARFSVHNCKLKIEKCKLQIKLKSENIREDCMTRTMVCGAVFLLSLTSAVAQSTQSSSDCAEIKAQVTRLEARLRDWPALARYRDANTKVKAPPKGEHRVVFMGDSITDSWDD